MRFVESLETNLMERKKKEDRPIGQSHKNTYMCNVQGQRGIQLSSA
jgi:hypothetical protein